MWWRVYCITAMGAMANIVLGLVDCYGRYFAVVENGRSVIVLDERQYDLVTKATGFLVVPRQIVRDF